MNNFSLGHFRDEYKRDALLESRMLKDPLSQARLWIEEAIQCKGSREPNAMALASVSTHGMPSVRMVLLKELSSRGFVFFTHYESKKAKQMKGNQQAALLFFWDLMERQLRVEGKVALLPPEVSDAYYGSRPYGSKISALISPQSQVIVDREVLAREWEEQSGRHPEPGPPRPSHWGGYVLIPSLFEFWQGRENRLHDRIQYRLDGHDWVMERLAP